MIKWVRALLPSAANAEVIWSAAEHFRSGLDILRHISLSHASLWLRQILIRDLPPPHTQRLSPLGAYDHCVYESPNTIQVSSTQRQVALTVPSVRFWAIPLALGWAW